MLPFRNKVEDSPSPRKLSNLVPRLHTEAHYPVSGPVLQTCVLGNTGQTNGIFFISDATVQPVGDRTQAAKVPPGVLD
jgi:hypothetical protein